MSSDSVTAKHNQAEAVLKARTANIV